MKDQLTKATIDDQFIAMTRTTMVEPKHRIYNYKYAKQKRNQFKTNWILPWSIELDDDEFVSANSFVEIGVVESENELLRFTFGS